MAERPPTIDVSAGPDEMGPGPSPFSRFFSSLGASREAFRLPAKPLDWIIPIAIVIVVLVASAALLQDLHMAKAADQMRAQIQANTNMPADKKAEALEKLQEGGAPSFVRVTLFATPFFVVPLGSLVVAALLLVMTNFVLGGAARFSHLWLVTALSWSPKAVEAILYTILAKARSSTDIVFGPGAFFGADTFPRRLLAGLDLFDVWMLVIQIVGVGVVARMTRDKATTAVLPLWILWWLILMGVAVATRGMPGIA